ncbi:AAA family ATPase [Streptomyces aidingensis]|uniref:Nuclease SbcCD subunit C n=1 Tax=Streptomyces aidingensis TaxID=910347 RepID=A0A1I1VE05_9ACTN|nr:AAA family ATPase [Streptomyces aidingensis]SFD81005.1 DNA sulfur modification protein DndD [Streptomyces aidingensis]
MKLLKLTIDNFRVFHGRHVLKLDVTEDKPTILIFGMNGAGKTTLLNAFIWALYGKFTDDVEHQERIINDRVWQEASFGTTVQAGVRLEFEHEGAVFSVRREVRAIKETEAQKLPAPQLVVNETRQGESNTITNGQDRIEKILPEGLRRFFFFNGERMERMFTRDGSGEVQNAIKTLMGLEMIERAIDDHLPAATRKLTTAAKKLGGGRLQALAQVQEDLERKIAAARDRQRKLAADISSYQAEVEATNKALLDNREAAPLQMRRAKLAKDREQERLRLLELQERQRRALAERGFIAFTAGLDQTVIDLAEGMRRRQELPAGIQRDYINGLLDDGYCMCGTAVPPGSPAHAALTERLSNAGLADVQARWMNLRGNAARLVDARNALLEELRSISSDLQAAGAKIDDIDAEESDIARQLKGVDVVDVPKLEDRRAEFDAKRVEALGAHRDAEREIERLQEDLTRSRRQFRAAKVEDDEARRLQRQMGLVEEVLDAFHRILQVRTAEVRQELDAKVKNVFSRICIKPFTPELSSRFELKLHANVAGPAAIRSTGENQILGLSFVGAVSEMAKEIHVRKRKTDGGGLDEGGIYPVVMDAPFGNLDIEYQDQVAESVPRLTSQIVTLLSQSQARGQVLRHLQASASRMYVLRSVTSKEDAKEQTITINNRAVPYVTRGDFEHTILEEVTA